MGSSKINFILTLFAALSFDSFNVVDSSGNSCKCTCSHSSGATVLRSRSSETELKASPAQDPCKGSRPRPQARVYEGRAALEGERPFQVHLYFVKPNKLSSWCGGSIYNSNTVVTAAHCYFGRSAEPESIVATVGDLSYAGDPGKGQWMVGTEVLLHPGYNGRNFQGGHDLALIRLNGSYTYNQLVQPIGLIDPSAELVGKLVVVSGWGQMSLGAGPVTNPEALQLVELTVIPAQACAKVLTSAGKIRITEKYFETKICASGITSTRSGCPGDSGGPVTCQVETSEGSVTKLCGVVHGGFGCGCGLPDLYTDLRNPKMYQWLRENAGEPDSPTIKY